MENKKLIEKCRLTDRKINSIIRETNWIAIGDRTERTWLNRRIRIVIYSQLAKAIPLISAEARKQERERIKIDYQTFIDFACNVAKHFDECRDSRIGFIMQQAFGDIEWEEAQDIINTVISQGQALKEGGKEAE